MNCEQHFGAGTCPNPAAAIWTWVTGDKVAVCLDHKVAARAIAQAMGYAAIFTEIPGESGDEDELSRLRNANAALQERLTLSRCSFCGSEMPRAESAGHMLSCEKHPIAALMKDRDEWRTKALDAGKHPAVVALMKELDAARAELTALSRHHNECANVAGSAAARWQKEREGLRAELADARRGEAALREALRIATAHLCELLCYGDDQHRDACVQNGRLLAGELAGEAGT